MQKQHLNYFFVRSKYLTIIEKLIYAKSSLYKKPRRKKSEPLKITVSFADKTHNQDEINDAFIALAKLACSAGVEKRFNKNGLLEPGHDTRKARHRA